jgi:chromosome segregation ATPase
MSATYVFKNASTIKYTGKGLKCGALHQERIMGTLAGSAGMTQKQLIAKFEAEEDRSWTGTATVSIRKIVRLQLKKLVKNGAIEAVKPGFTQLKEQAEAVGADLATARAGIKAVQKKARATKAKEYYLKQKAAIFELKAKADLLEQENAALKGALEAKAVEFSELNAQFAEVQAQVAAQHVLLENAGYDLMEAATEVKDVKGELALVGAQLQDVKADLDFAAADLMYQKVEVGMLKDELDDEQRYVASLNREANHLNTEVTSLRFLLLLEFMLAVGAGIYLMVHYQPPVSQLQIGY